jgi:hypothetical protein
VPVLTGASVTPGTVTVISAVSAPPAPAVTRRMPNVAGLISGLPTTGVTTTCPLPWPAGHAAA